MQPLNDDMDNLFRRAAESYPLNISGSDWSKVQQALHNQPVTPPVPEKEEKRRYFLFFLLFPLVVFSFLGYKYFINNIDNPADTQQIVHSVPSDAAPQVQPNRPTSRATIIQSVVATLKLTQGLKQQVGKTTLSNSKPANRNLVINDNPPPVSTVLPGNKNATATVEKNYEAVTNEITGADALFSLNGKLQGRSADPLFNSRGLKTVSPADAIVHNSFSRPKRFYAGLLGGIDGTTVKFQKITNVGKDYGILIGYQLNKKLSIETGLIDEKKYYYSSGEYFSTKNISLPPNSKITKVDGNCRMFEIPLVLKYNLSHFKNGQWFATTGFTNYFMRKESYEYTYYYPATNRSRDYYASYNTKRNSLVSNLQLSAGYTHLLGHVADLRVEPYVKIPLRGVGTGLLPLTSGGIRIAITRKLF